MQNSGTVQPLMVGVSDAGKLIGVSKHTVRSWCYKGLLRGLKVGSRLLIPYAELERISREGLQNDNQGKFKEAA